MQAETFIHPLPSSKPGAELGAGRQDRAVLPCRRRRGDRRPTSSSSAMSSIMGATTLGAGTQGLPAGGARRPAAERQAQGRPHHAGDRQQLHDPRRRDDASSAPTPAAARRPSATTATSSPTRMSRMTASSAATSPSPIGAMLAGHCEIGDYVNHRRPDRRSSVRARSATMPSCRRMLGRPRRRHSLRHGARATAPRCAASTSSA